ncbi:MAG: hypothetical protein L0Y58_11420 [Verrucomicrobia subdivision 3 bacterium]|nr:hypothetical protein [Limisphaerales bacterium]
MNNTVSKVIRGSLGGALIAVLATTSALAQSQPSSKATAKVGNINVLREVSSPAAETIGPWQTILSNTLKTPNQKDLFIGVSLEVGLLTRTEVKSKNGVADTALAAAGVQVQVLVDGEPALPGTVVFGRRTQTLTAVFQGLIDGCLTNDPVTGGIIIDPDCVEPEVLELILETMNANAFNFIVQDLTPGVHLIEVQARINLGATAQAGSATARGLVGKGSMTVEEVRLIKTPDIELP